MHADNCLSSFLEAISSAVNLKDSKVHGEPSTIPCECVHWTPCEGRGAKRSPNSSFQVMRKHVDNPCQSIQFPLPLVTDMKPPTSKFSCYQVKGTICVSITYTAKDGNVS